MNNVLITIKKIIYIEVININYLFLNVNNFLVNINIVRLTIYKKEKVIHILIHKLLITNKFVNK